MTFKQLIAQINIDFPDIVITPADEFAWSPRGSTISFKKPSPSLPATQAYSWSLLHELGHAILDHHTYDSDFMLLKLEAAAWQQANVQARQYGIHIDPNHVQDCLDTYRDWLHTRSTCPKCSSHGAQTDAHTYRCLNCQAHWRVSASRFCRPHRRVSKTGVN